MTETPAMLAREFDDAALHRRALALERRLSTSSQGICEHVSRVENANLYETNASSKFFFSFFFKCEFAGRPNFTFRHLSFKFASECSAPRRRHEMLSCCPREREIIIPARSSLAEAQQRSARASTPGGRRMSLRRRRQARQGTRPLLPPLRRQRRPRRNTSTPCSPS